MSIYLDIFFLNFSKNNYIFLVQAKAFAPLPHTLADISAKNVGIFGLLPIFTMF